MKNILMGILIIIILVVAIPNSNAQNYKYNVKNYYDDNYVNNLNINQSNYDFLVGMTSSELMRPGQQGIDTEKIWTVMVESSRVAAPANAGGKADLNKGYQLILEARKMIIEARDKIMIDPLSEQINRVNSEIKNATSIGADTKPAVAKLEEAKRALAKKDYNNASLLVGEAYGLALTSNVGFVSIKDLISSRTVRTLSSPESKYDRHRVETTGLIRNIKTSGASYNFVIDDGNGVISIAYSGGLGDIKEGDSVSVKGVYNNQNINAESVSKGSGLVGGISSNVKAPGFEAILAISIIGVLWLRKKL
jgi:cytochrome c-type biogenesis protein CcmE